MNEEKLKQLLRNADQAIPDLPPLAIDVNGIRRRVITRRRQYRLVAMGIMMVMGIGGLWFHMCLQESSSRIVETPLDPQKEIVMLQAGIDSLSRTLASFARQTRAEKRLASLQSELQAIENPMIQIRDYRNQAAGILFKQAEQLAQQRSQRRQAKHRYERLIQLFPQSGWATLARDRLARMQVPREEKPQSQGDIKWHDLRFTKYCSPV
jgi:hypothetical protein